MNARPFDLVIFDWDGTLADSTSMIAQALQNACRDMGCAVPDDEAARYVIGLGLADALRHVAPDLSPDDYPRLSSHYRNHYLSRESEIPLFDGARALLSDLRAAGHRLGIATGKSRVGLDRALAFHGVDDTFHATRCADEGRPKPYPDMVLHLLKVLDVDAQRAVVVGDTTHDLDMANRAGVRAIAVTHGAHAEMPLRQLRPLALARSLSELRVTLLEFAS